MYDTDTIQYGFQTVIRAVASGDLRTFLLQYELFLQLTTRNGVSFNGV